MSRRFVFVPIFGDTEGDPAEHDLWLKAPHVKAWGFYDAGLFAPIHTDPPCTALELHSTSTLFEAEIAAMVNIPENSTDLPDAVCLALAKLTLLPVTQD